MHVGEATPPVPPGGPGVFTAPRRWYKRYDLLLLALSALLLFAWPKLWQNLLSSGYMSHGHCYFWVPELVTLHLVSDVLIGLAYVSISSTLTFLVYRARRDMPFHWVFLAFGLFIVACGMTHWMEVWTIWHATYWLSGYVKLVTAVASVATAMILPPLVPRTLGMVRAAKLSEERKAHLERANRELEELREREGRRAAQRIAQLAAIVESSEDAILGETLEGVITSWNGGAERLYGYTAAEAVGRHLTMIVPPERHAEVPAFLGRVRRGEATGPFETARVTKGGALIEVSVTASPVKDAEGNIVGASTIARDITARKRAEAERAELLAREQASRARAEEANRLKDEFLATVSHELRTPLTSILGWSSMLRTLDLGPEAAARALETIEHNARAQAHIVDDILDVSRIVTGKLRLERRPVELTPLVELAVDSARPSAGAKGIALSTALDPGVEIASGDPDRLRQVVLNLISNAVKFTPAGGAIEVRLVRGGDFVELTVSDTGVGIGREFLPHVFDRFRQADSSTTREYGGLGLGLSIARHLVELHGGTIRADSRGAGRGATFTVQLPLAYTA